jgi:hypothetical protein
MLYLYTKLLSPLPFSIIRHTSTTLLYTKSMIFSNRTKQRKKTYAPCIISTTNPPLPLKYAKTAPRRNLQTVSPGNADNSADKIHCP